jgi:hypothetical protein
MRRRELTQGAKIIYTRLAQYAGIKAYARVKQETLALETGCSLAQLRRHIDELVHFGLIESQQIGLTKSNIYHFLQHPWMSDQKQAYSTVNKQDKNIPDCSYMSSQELAYMSSQELAHVSNQEVAHMSDPLNRSSEKIPLKEHTKKKERVCVPNIGISAYSKEQWFYYAKAQKNVHTPEALADKLAGSKDNDHLMKEFLETQEQEKKNSAKAALEAQEQALRLEREKYILVKQILALGEPLYPWQTQFLHDHQHLLSNQQIC